MSRKFTKSGNKIHAKLILNLFTCFGFLASTKHAVWSGLKAQVRLVDANVVF